MGSHEVRAPQGVGGSHTASNKLVESRPRAPRGGSPKRGACPVFLTEHEWRNMTDEELDARIKAVEWAARSRALTTRLALSIAEVMRFSGATKEICYQMAFQLGLFLRDMPDEVAWTKHAKYVLAFPLSHYLGETYPESPNGIPGFRPLFGHVWRWMRPRLHKFSKRNTFLWMSWLQAKRGCLEVCQSVVLDSYVKHFGLLTKDDPCTASDVAELLSHPLVEVALDRFRDSVSHHYPSEDRRHVAGSLTACFEQTRGSGGQHCELMTLCGWAPRRPRKGWCYKDKSLPKYVDGKKNFRMTAKRFWDMQGWVVPNKEFVGMTPLRCSPWRIVEVWDYPPEIWDGLRLHELEDPDFNFDPPSTEEEVAGGCLRHPYCVNDAPYGAKIQAVLEPLKVRVISKGPALPYHRCKPLQQSLWKAMQSFPCFLLTGKSICHRDLLSIRASTPEVVRAGEGKWRSVDYSSATDGCSSLLGLAVLDRVTEGLPQEIRLEARKVLGPHELWYPGIAFGGDNRRHVPIGTQRRGQLMGSILSFPILCLLNLIVFIHTMFPMNEDDQLYVHEWSDLEGWGLLQAALRSVLINGDDMAFASLDQEWERCKGVAKRVGFEMTVGKTYSHREYVNMNSQAFHVPLGDLKDAGCQPGFINVGLLFGQSKVLGTCDDNEDMDDLEQWEVEAQEALGIGVKTTSVASTYDTLIESIHHPVLRLRATRRFIKYNLDKLREESCVFVTRHQFVGKGTKIRQFRYLAFRNWWLHTSVGGMGMTPPPGWKFKVTRLDRLIYKKKRILDSWIGVRHDTGLPLCGAEYEEVKRDLGLCKDSLVHNRVSRENLDVWLCDDGLPIPHRVWSYRFARFRVGPPQKGEGQKGSRVEQLSSRGAHLQLHNEQTEYIAQHRIYFNSHLTLEQWLRPDLSEELRPRGLRHVPLPRRLQF